MNQPDEHTTERLRQMAVKERERAVANGESAARWVRDERTMRYASFAAETAATHALNAMAIEEVLATVNELRDGLKLALTIWLAHAEDSEEFQRIYKLQDVLKRLSPA